MKQTASVLVILIVAMFASYGRGDEPSTPQSQDSRIAQLESSLKDALKRIDALEDDNAKLKKQLASMPKGGPGAKAAVAAKPANEPLLLGSKWRGKTFGRLGNNQPVPNNGGPIEGEILASTDDAFTIRMEVRRDLVFTIDLKLSDGQWQIDKMDANPAGAGRPGPITVQAARVKVSSKSIEIYVEAPTLNGPGSNKITYQLEKVNK